MKFPRWLSWLFVLFLVYMIYEGNRSARQQQAGRPPEPAPAQSSAAYPSLQALTDGKRWLHAINPEYQSPDEACAAPPPEADTLASYAIINTPGSGDGAVCGDTIQLRITWWNSQGHIARTEKITLVLGEQKSLDALLVGIAPGEIRTVFLRSQEACAKLPALKKNQQQTLTIERAVPTPGQSE